MGVDAVLIPVYLPVEMDYQPPPRSRIFFGGVSVFLEQYFPLFRWTPGWLDRLWDNPWILGLVGRLSRSTRPEKLGPLTLSMLAGEEGNQRKELQKLLRFLKEELRPNLVHLSTGLLVGMARAIREVLKIPVVANLAGEVRFLERLPEHYRVEARKLAATRLAELEALVALSQYYASGATEYFQLLPDKVWIIPPGVTVPNGDQIGSLLPRLKILRGEICLGYLGRICSEKGLDVLLGAARQLAGKGFASSVRWLVAGRVEPPFGGTFSRLLHQVRRSGAQIDYLGPVDAATKEAFFASLQALVVPSVIPEPKAVTAIEAVARGIPVVAPAHGAFVEIVEQSGCGELYWPNEPDRLSEVLAQWIARGTGRREKVLDLKEELAPSRAGRSGSPEEANPASRFSGSSEEPPVLLGKNPSVSCGWGRPHRLAEIYPEVAAGSVSSVVGGLSPCSVTGGETRPTKFPRRGPHYYRAERMAEQTLALYRLLLSGAGRACP
jgi:glycosyltransferase involved in cell wall biosynthesis